MGSLASARSIGAERATLLARRFGSELRLARTAAALSQRRLGALAGCTQQEVSRAERGSPHVGLELRCRLLAACGHELAIRVYPVATVSLRDSRQLAIATQIIKAVPASTRVALEVPVAPGDRRAADMLLTTPDELIHIEIERSLIDVQAQLRAAQVKRRELAARDSRPVRLVIAAPSGPSTQRALLGLAEIIDRALPATSRACWAAIRSGGLLGRDGFMLVRAGR